MTSPSNSTTSFCSSQTSFQASIPNSSASTRASSPVPSLYYPTHVGPTNRDGLVLAVEYHCSDRNAHGYSTQPCYYYIAQPFYGHNTTITSSPNTYTCAPTPSQRPSVSWDCMSPPDYPLYHDISSSYHYPNFQGHLYGHAPCLLPRQDTNDWEAYLQVPIDVPQSAFNPSENTN